MSLSAYLAMTPEKKQKLSELLTLLEAPDFVMPEGGDEPGNLQHIFTVALDIGITAERLAQVTIDLPQDMVEKIQTGSTVIDDVEWKHDIMKRVRAELQRRYSAAEFD